MTDVNEELRRASRLLAAHVHRKVLHARGEKH
jgi:hypothetical protein